MRYRVTTTQDPPVTLSRRLRSRSSCSVAFGSWSSPTISTYVPYSSTKEIWDVETLKFQALLEKCGKRMLPINPVTIRTTTTEALPGGLALHLQSDTASCWKSEQVTDRPVWLSTAWLVTAPEFDQSLIDTVKTMAISQLRAASYDALTDLVELGKTIALFHDLANKMDGFIMEVIRRVRVKVRNFKRPPSYSQLLTIFSEIASEYWLKYRYGVMPVVYSLEDILRSQKNQKGGILREKSSLTDTFSDGETLSWGTLPEQYNTVQTIDCTRIYRATAFGQVDLQGLGSFDPVVTAWETLRWSFILDWLVDVGSFLQAVSPFAQVTTKAVCLSVRSTVVRRQDTELSWANVSATNRHSGSSGVCSTIETVEEYTRWAADTSVPWPVWNPRLNIKRVTDLVALVIGMKSKWMKLLRL